MTDPQFDRTLAALPRQRTQLLPALLLAQARFGHVSDWAVERIAGHLRLTVNDVEGVVTSYPDLRRQPFGRHVLRVCTGLSCRVAGGGRLLDTLEAAIGIRAGETTPDRRVTLETTPCCFICAVAPAVELDGNPRGRVDDAEIHHLIALATGG